MKEVWYQYKGAENYLEKLSAYAFTRVSKSHGYGDIVKDSNLIKDHFPKLARTSECGKFFTFGEMR